MKLKKFKVSLINNSSYIGLDKCIHRTFNCYYLDNMNMYVIKTKDLINKGAKANRFNAIAYTFLPKDIQILSVLPEEEATTVTQLLQYCSRNNYGFDYVDQSQSCTNRNRIEISKKNVTLLIDMYELQISTIEEIIETFNRRIPKNQKDIIEENLSHEELLSLLDGNTISFIDNDDYEIRISGKNFNPKDQDYVNSDNAQLITNQAQFAKRVLKLNLKDFHNMTGLISSIDMIMMNIVKNNQGDYYER